MILGYKFTVQDIQNLESNGTYEYDFIGPRLSSRDLYSRLAVSPKVSLRKLDPLDGWMKDFLLYKP